MNRWNLYVCLSAMCARDRRPVRTQEEFYKNLDDFKTKVFKHIAKVDSPTTVNAMAALFDKFDYVICQPYPVFVCVVSELHLEGLIQVHTDGSLTLEKTTA